MYSSTCGDRVSTHVQKVGSWFFLIVFGTTTSGSSWERDVQMWKGGGVSWLVGGWKWSSWTGSRLYLHLFPSISWSFFPFPFFLFTLSSTCGEYP